MSQIVSIHARQVLDSRANPTVEAEVMLESGGFGRAMVPSGASTGKFEAKELRDQDPKLYSGKSVLKAVEQIHTRIASALMGMEGEDQAGVDGAMLELHKHKPLGANATLAVSLALAKAAADEQGVGLYRYLGGAKANLLPSPMLNVINGGKHASNPLAIQEFMVCPKAGSFSEALRKAVEIYHQLARLLEQKGLATTVGDEGGFGGAFKDSSQALDLLVSAIQKAGFKPAEEVELALDVAASELLEKGKYKVDGKQLSGEELGEYYKKLIAKYPIKSIEDPFGEEDYPAWQNFTAGYQPNPSQAKSLPQANSLQIVGDDLLVTNPKLIQKGITERLANAVLIKPNQIGTLTQTLEAVTLAQKAGWGVVISHRSGETEDTTIADLAVATGAGQIKTGAPARSDRTAKYNQLLRIEEELATAARFG